MLRAVKLGSGAIGRISSRFRSGVLGKADQDLLENYRVIGKGGAMLDGTANNSASNYTRIETRRPLWLGGQPVKKIRFIFANVLMAAGELNAADAITMEFGLERVSPAQTVMFTFNGQPTVTLQPGEMATTDSIDASAFGLAEFPANELFWMRTGGVVASGDTWSFSSLVSNPSGTSVGRSSHSATSQVSATGAMTTPPGGNGGIVGPSPTAVIGTWAGTPDISLYVDGDSIVARQNDSADNGVSGGGFITRGIRSVDGRSIPQVKVARGSVQAAHWNNGNTVRQYLMQFCTHYICNFGINDLVTGAYTAAQTLANKQAIWAAFRSLAKGPKYIIDVPVGPYTTSTDGYVTVANQTPVSGYETGGTKRSALNNSVLALVGEATGPDEIIDVNLDWADGTATDKWIASGTVDGVHPATTPHIAAGTRVTNAAHAWDMSGVNLNVDRIVAFGGYVPDSQHDNAGGTYDRLETRMWSKFGRQDVAYVRLVIYNGFLASGVIEAANGNAITVEAGVERVSPAATVVATWGGASSVTVASGGIAVSDPIPASAFSLGAFPAGEAFFIRTGVTGFGLGKVPQSSAVYTAVSGEASKASLGAGSQINATGALTGGTNYKGLIPLGIIGGWSGTPDVSLLVMGDSIATLTNDEQFNGTAGGGFITEGCASVGGGILAAAKLSRGGERAAVYATATNNPARRFMMRFATHLIENYGVNDLRDGTSAATLLTYSQALWALFRARAKGVQHISHVPVATSTTSTDSFATLANQTEFSAAFNTGGARDTYNTSVVALVGAANGPSQIIDTNLDWLDGGEPDKWRVNGAANWATADGLHPSPDFHSLASYRVNTYAGAWEPTVTAGTPPLKYSPSIWLDADDAGSITKDGADLVSAWADNSGNTNDAAQAVADYQPLYVASGIGGSPSLQMFHTGVTRSQMDVADDATLAYSGVGYTAVLVMQRDGDSGNTEHLFGKYTPNANWRMGISAGGSDDAHHVTTNSGTTGNVGSVTAIPVGTPKVITGMYTGADGAQSVQIRVNGSGIQHVKGAVSGGVAEDTTQYSLGARGFDSTAFDGYLGEVLYFNRPLSTMELGQVESYLKLKWGFN